MGGGRKGGMGEGGDGGRERGMGEGGDGGREEWREGGREYHEEAALKLTGNH